MKAISIIPRYAIYALLLFAPLARGAVQPWAVTTIHLLTLCALTAFLLLSIQAGSLHWIKTPLDRAFAVLIALCLLSTTFSLAPRLSIRSLILLLDYVIVFYLVIHTFRTRNDLRRLIHLLMGITALLVIFGLFKYLGDNPFPWWEYTDIRPYTGRLTSTFGNPDHLAGWTEMVLPLTLGLFLLQPRGNKLVALASLTVLCLTALILTLSRGGWFSTAIALLFMGAFLLKDRHFHRKSLLAGIGGAVGLALLVVLSTTQVVERIRTLTDNTPQANMEGRLKAYSGTLEMIQQNLALGTGPGTYAQAFPYYQPPALGVTYTKAHNDYLHAAAETGIFLAPVLAWMMYAVYRKGFNKLKNASRLVRGTTLGALSGITAILVHSLGDFNLHIPANAILLTVLLAIPSAPVPQAGR